MTSKSSESQNEGTRRALESNGFHCPQITSSPSDKRSCDASQSKGLKHASNHPQSADNYGTTDINVEKRRFNTVESSSGEDNGMHISKSVIVSAMANLSTAYNLAVINYAILLIEQNYPPTSPELSSMVASCSLVGAIMGQLSFGYIGHLIGRKHGMIATLLLSIVGALSSALLPWGESSIYYILAACRFILGVGVGGVYPLSATSAAESSDNQERNSKVTAAVFSFQGIGQLLAPGITYILLLSPLDSAYEWRVLLVVGALPGLIVLQNAFQATEAASDNRQQSVSPMQEGDTAEGDEQQWLWSQLRQDAYLRKRMIGACLGWFVFDLTFYGNVIFTPTILEDTFGYDRRHLSTIALSSTIVAAVALPGYFISVFAVGRLSFRIIQINGFVCMGIIFCILGFFYEPLLAVDELMLSLYALTFFFANFGPNVSTFSLPAHIFEKDVRVKLNGIAAAVGKVGAALGAGIFGLMEESYGVSSVLVFSGVLSLLGAVITYAFIPTRKEMQMHL